MGRDLLVKRASAAVLFFAARAVTRLRNAGEGPAAYYVLSFVTPATPKS